MPRLRRRYEYNGVYLVGNRVADGLPFVANLYLTLLLFGVLARAMLLYPGVIVCAWIFMGNHYHGLVILRADPEQFAAFMKYVDGEIAKLMNRLRGVSNRNVWASRYDAQQLLTPEAVIEKLAYVFLNPARADLVDSICQYPGASTWHEFLGKAERSFKFVSSSKVKKLLNKPFGRAYCKLLLHQLDELELAQNPLNITPFAWKECFPDSCKWEDENIRKQVVEKVVEGEKEAAKKRNRQGRISSGPESLEQQNFFKPYRPKKYGQRSICISTCRETRAAFVASYRAFCEQCRIAWQRWKVGDFTVIFPPGAFRPVMPPTASIIAG